MKQQLSVSIGQSSDKGVKEQNEDSYGVLIPEDQQLESKGITAIVADGMGSCLHPKEASEYCVKGFLNDYYSTADSWTVKTSAAKVLTALNSWLFGKSSNEAKAYVSTFSALVIKSTTAYILHIGDSRIYRYRSGTLEQLTSDHRIRFSAEKDYLSRAIGIDLHLDIDYKSLEVDVGDIFLMSTDGIHDFMSDASIKNILKQNTELQNISDELVDTALKNGSHDNVTAQLVRIEQLPSQEANEVYKDLTRLPFPPELEPGMEIDGYKVIKEINASARSQLYLVEDIASGKKMAMKTPSVNFDDDPSYIDQFHLEEWAGKRIKQTHVLETLEPERTRHYTYFLMEYLQGITLAEWITAHPKPDIKDVTAIIEQVIHGLRAIHRMEMLHRDLKPDNIFISKDGTVKIIDLGSVKIAGVAEISSPIERSELLGTRNYTAPEYLMGMAGSSQSDLFSLGIICYEMLTGKLPYDDKLNKETNWRNVSDIKYTSALQFNPMVPLWLDGAIKKSVRCEQRLRYENLSEFFHDLTHPNELFMHNNLPLLERDPLKLWKIISATLLACNLLLIYILFSHS